MADPTLATLAARAARRDGGSVALRRREQDGRWSTLTNAELHARVREIARGLLAAGVAPGDRVGLWSANRPDWIAIPLRGIVTAASALAPRPASGAA